MASMDSVISLANGAASVIKLFTFCWDVIDKIRELVRVNAENDRRCRKILSQCELIKGLLDHLYTLELSELVIASIENVEGILKDCEKYVDKLSDRALAQLRDILQSVKIRDEMEQLQKELDSAVIILNASMAAQNMAHHQRKDISCWSGNRTETGPIPGKPRSLRVVKRADKRIQLVWYAPSKNPEAVCKYEIQYRRRRRQWDDKECVTTLPNCVVDGLSSDTYYWFRVRAVNENGFPGRFIEDVLTKTKYSPSALKAIFTGATVGGVVVGTVPIIGRLCKLAILQTSIELMYDNFGDGEVDPNLASLAAFVRSIRPRSISAFH